ADTAFTAGRSLPRGDVLTTYPANEYVAIPIEFFGAEIERIVQIAPLTGEILVARDHVDVYPARHWVTTHENLQRAVHDIEEELAERLAQFKAEDKVLEAARLEQRTNFDLEMLKEFGYCNGVENYSRHLSGRAPGEQPWCLLDYLPDDFLMFIDESHIAIPQAGAMYAGDRSRKEGLVEYGFRLPTALD